MEQYVDNYTHIGKVVSLATIVNETNRALHENREEYYTIPDNADLVSQELLLFENSGSDDLEDVEYSQFSKAENNHQTSMDRCVCATEVLGYVKEVATKTFPDDKVITTGMIPLLINTFSHAVSSSVTSCYFIAFVGISLMMMLILGSVRIGLLSMIPNLTPIILGLLLMYYAHIPLICSPYSLVP